MPDFTKGQRVRIADFAPSCAGREGEVRSIDPDRELVLVKILGIGWRSYLRNELSALVPRRVIVHFVDGNRAWHESGTLRTTGRGWALDRSDGGTRVFPLDGSSAEVYALGDGTPDEPVIHTNNNDVLVDEWSTWAHTTES